VPFGSGAHRCIGEALASIQAMLVLATLAQEVRLRLRRDARVKPEGMITIRPGGAVPMAVEVRSY
jgi:cytochrome P450